MANTGQFYRKPSTGKRAAKGAALMGMGAGVYKASKSAAAGDIGSGVAATYRGGKGAGRFGQSAATAATAGGRSGAAKGAAFAGRFNMGQKGTVHATKMGDVLGQASARAGHAMSKARGTKFGAKVAKGADMVGDMMRGLKTLAR